MRLAVLLGAGASYGCGPVTPTAPPLGAQLYDALRDRFPETWGTLITPDEDTAFRSDPPFEKGMGELWETNDERTQRLIIDLALFFAEFAPAGPDNRYGDLLDILRRRHLLGASVFASLNYDCLFELTAGTRGLNVDHTSGMPHTDRLTLLKPHGSCNFVMRGLGEGIVMRNVVLSHVGSYYEGPIEPRHPSSVAGLYAEGPSIPPAISLYSPGKPSPIAGTAIGQMRDRWRTWVAGADPVVVIGARVVLDDGHVWEPIIANSRASVWFVGDPVGADFSDFAERLEGRLTQLAPRFDEAIPIIDRRLQILG
jgi:hypothetical protein